MVARRQPNSTTTDLVRVGDVYSSFVALGDSFTEGLDDLRPDGTYRGWADLVATELATGTAGFRYANLAVRGRRLAQIRDEQLPLALAMGPDLVTIAGGGNDIIGLRCDVPALTRSMRDVLEQLHATGATLLVFAGFDPRGRLPLGRSLAARAAGYNASLVGAAHDVGAHVVDLWHLPELYQDDMWAPDRLHLSSRGHELVASTVLRTLGVPSSAGTEHLAEVAAEARRSWLAARRSDATWFRTYFAPWVGRQLRGRSAGDGVTPKHEELTALAEQEPDGSMAGNPSRSPEVP
jgi:lysophospholipase L1-like esterase